MVPKDLIILGGGASVLKGMEKGLFDLLPNTFCIGLNYSYKFVQTTAICGVDETFYNEQVNELVELPLYIGKEYHALKKRGPNTIFFRCNDKYDRELDKGIYTPTLTGLFCLSLFIRFLDVGNIYLLGYDYGPLKNDKGEMIYEDQLPRKPLTHWYQGKFQHRGIGKINWYTATVIDYDATQKRISHAEKEFRPYAEEPKVKIWNVSPDSNIPYFEKINYEQFFQKIKESNMEGINQEELRKELKEELIKFKAERKL